MTTPPCSTTIKTIQKCSRLLLAALAPMAGISAHATLLATEQFDYPANGTLGSSTTLGSTNWSGSSSLIAVSDSAALLAPSGFAAAAGRGCAVTNNAATSSLKYASFTNWNGVASTAGNVLYASFLLNVQALPSANGNIIAGIHNAGKGDNQNSLNINLSTTGQLGIQKKAGGVTNAVGTPFSSQGTHLVVVRYSFTGVTGMDEVALWVDPSSGSYGAAAEPAPGAATTNGVNAGVTLNYFNLVAQATSSFGNASYWIDEIRLGTNWADVTPSDNATNAGTPANISLDPKSVSAYVGQSADFNVVAGGTAPLVYQWYFNTNTAIAAATNSTLSLTNLQTTNAGAYFCIVTNSYGSDTSAVAQLTVAVPVAPGITTQPQNATVLPGASATFTVSASGSTPLNYQWYFNTNTAIAGANSSTLTVNNVQATNAGTYSVAINNLAGATNSAYAVLALDNSPVAPSFVTQPAAVVALAGSTASFSANASGTAPIYYQWLKNGSPVAGATNTVLTLTNVQNADAAAYSLRASNSVNVATSTTAALTVTTATTLPFSEFNLTGFGRATTGGGVVAETNSAYVKVTNALDLANALVSASKTAGAVKVIEIMNDLDLGWNEIGSTVQNLSSSPFRSHTTPSLHPRLLVTGVSLIDIKPKSGLTIFSANGATIRHATFNIKGCTNVIVRNLKFDEMWEWDESTKGNYDHNDWDFIDLGNGGAVSNIWVDHCTFTKTYDGILDTKAGSSLITISWCKYVGDDGATNMNSFVRQQIVALESNRTSYAFYNFLRNNGFSTNDIITIIQGHDKTHLAGANSLDSGNATLSMTFHHLWMNNVWDRAVPRLRGGNVHDYNNYVDDTLALAAKNLRNARAAAMSTANQNTLNNTYNIDPPLNGSISTENGALLVERSVYINNLWPLRNNQTDPANPVYTGKIMALDSVYQMGSTTFRGNSTDPGGVNTFGPLQAAIIPFSWNTNSGAPNGVLPYTYTTDDPSQLQGIVAAGAGAGAVNWNKTNWLATTYAPTAPVITAQPQGQTVAPGNAATFTVIANGSANLYYQWYFNTNTAIAGATNTSLTLASVQSTNTGKYSVVVTNSAGTATSSFAALAFSSGTHPQPQIAAAGFSNGKFGFSVSGDSGVDYIVQASTNLADWDSIFTNHSPVPPFNWSDTNTAPFGRRFYRIQLGQ